MNFLYQYIFHTILTFSTQFLIHWHHQNGETNFQTCLKSLEGKEFKVELLPKISTSVESTTSFMLGKIWNEDSNIKIKPLKEPWWSISWRCFIKFVMNSIMFLWLLMLICNMLCALLDDTSFLNSHISKFVLPKCYQFVCLTMC